MELNQSLSYSNRNLLLCFYVMIFEKTYMELKSKGVNFAEEPKKMAWRTFAKFVDIDGNEIRYAGYPVMAYENPNKKLGENVTLIEDGEYRCRECNNLVLLNRKFNDIVDIIF
jgi:hypothetical protein